VHRPGTQAGGAGGPGGEEDWTFGAGADRRADSAALPTAPDLIFEREQASGSPLKGSLGPGQGPVEKFWEAEVGWGAGKGERGFWLGCKWEAAGTPPHTSH
jgi:hypothetical protein